TRGAVPRTGAKRSPVVRVCELSAHGAVGVKRATDRATLGLLVTLACAARTHRGGAPMPVARSPVDVALRSISSAALMADVAWMTSPALHGRGLYTEDARKTADLIDSAFRTAGLQVRRQDIPDAPGQTNVIGVLPGSSDVVVICAHYDHLGV